MAEGFQKAVQIARSYGSLTRTLVERANAERLRVAQGNFDAGRTQISAQSRERSAELAGVFQRHVGQLKANAIYRGVGSAGSSAALVGASMAEAEVARRNIEINANNAVGALAAASQIETEDEALAEIEGAFRGLAIGGNFVEALASLAPVRTETSSWVNTGLGWQQLHNVNESPGRFDIRDIFPEFNELMEE